MELSTITGKGQTSIPVKVLRHLKLKRGDKVQYFIDAEGHVMLLPASRPIGDLEGMLAKPERARTIEEMNAGIAKGARERMK